jgi:AraC-like DNA-binding protein
VGIGFFLKAGTPLRPSVEGALRALRWTSYLDSQVLFMDEIRAEVPVPPKDVTDWTLGSRLLDSITQGVLATLVADREAYIQRILDREGRQLDLVRLHFTQWINRAVEALQQRPQVAGTDPAKRMAPHLGKIRSALMTADLVLCFKAATEELFELAARPLEGMRRMELREMLRRMREHPEFSWSLKRSASEMKWSAPTFSRRFRKETGNSFGVFLRRCRLDKARKLLAQGGLSITRISEESGFATPAYFAAAFRRAYGKPPHTFMGKSSETK